MARLKFILRCLVSVALIVFIARKVDWRALASILERIEGGWALLGSALTGLLIAGLALRWQMFLAQQRIELPFGTTISLTWAGQFFNSLLPGSTGGDVFKLYQICRLTPNRKAAAASTVLIDRLSALVALLVLAGGAFLAEPAPLSALLRDGLARIDILWLVVLAVIGIVLGWIFLRVLRSVSWMGRLARTLREIRKSLRWNRRLALGCALALMIHLLNFLIVYFLARSLRIDISYGKIFLVMPVLLLMMMLPITINGHGLRELLLIGYLTHMGIHIGARADVAYREVAIALSVLMVANDLLWSLPGGLVYFFRFRMAPEPDDVALR